jgi:hypothetical protein
MIRLPLAIALATMLMLGAISATTAQEKGGKTAKQGAIKVGKEEKLCNYRFPSGERRQWVCKKVEPCCAWDAINYVKCGSTITGCF